MDIHEIQAHLNTQFSDETILCSMDERHILTLRGSCSTWQKYIDIGHEAAALDGVRNVVSDMTVPGLSVPKRDYAAIACAGRAAGSLADADVVIIGAGISGCGIARELSAYQLRITVVEAGEDIAWGASRANSGCIHHGMDCKPGTLKSRLNVEGNRRYDDWDRELHLNLVRCGCIEYVTDIEDLPLLQARYEQGVKNKVPGIRLLDSEEAYAVEPALRREQQDVVSAVYMPSHGVVETPYVCIALAENAAENGVQFLFNCPVGAIETEDGHVSRVVTACGTIRTRWVINAAGLYADDIAEMVGDRFYTMHNRKGTLAVMDKGEKPTYSAMISNLSIAKNRGKNKNSKGGGSNRTPENNLLVGPSSKEVPDREDVETTLEELDYIVENCIKDPHKSKSDIIRIFSGARPAEFTEDFVIERSEKTGGFIHVAGIQSPGVASAPAIADMVVGFVLKEAREQGCVIHRREDFNPIRKAPIAFRHLSRAEQDALIRRNPCYGNIVCRCEQITEGEIIEAIHSPVQPRSVNAVKNRTRAGMGRCQGGFCQPKVVEILARELGCEQTDITLKGPDSNILLCDNRE